MIAASSQMLWYLTRATGIVALVLLSATVVLGVLNSVRFRTSSWPGFAIADLHRRISLLSLVFLGIHIVTAVSDSFVHIGWIAVIVPFTSSYRRLWLGFGTIAFDLILAVTVSSLLRQRIGARTWRYVHWLSYFSWPVAVLHALGTGTDPRLHWVLGLVIACVVAVLATAGWRLFSGLPDRPALRMGTAATAAVVTVGAVVWTVLGPLRPGWAARAGTPPSAVATGLVQTPGTVPASSSTPTSVSASPSAPSAAPISGATVGRLPTPPWASDLVGSVTQRILDNGNVEVIISAQTSVAVGGDLSVTLIGPSDGSGGVKVHSSRASFGPASAPDTYRGSVTSLNGSSIEMSLQDQSGGSLRLAATVLISDSSVTGRLVAAASRGGDGAN